MEITTESERLTDYRKNMLKLILSNHNQDYMSCPANGTCELQKLCNEYGVERAEHKGNRVKIEKKLPLLDVNPYISYDPSNAFTVSAASMSATALPATARSGAAASAISISWRHRSERTIRKPDARAVETVFPSVRPERLS